MAPLQYFTPCRKVHLLYLALFLSTCILLCCSYYSTEAQQLGTTRRMLELEDDDEPVVVKKKTTPLSVKNNKTKPIQTTSTKDLTKLIKTATGPAKNQTKIKLKLKLSSGSTKLVKPTKDSAQEESIPAIKFPLKKLNSTKNASNSTKKSSDLTKLGSPKNKTAKPNSAKKSLIESDEKLSGSEELKSENPDKSTPAAEKKPKSKKPKKKTTTPGWIDPEDDEDLVAGFRDLPSKFQEQLLPDLQRISTTSQVYFNKAGKQITRGFKPIVGKQYAPTIASLICFTFILLPLLLVSLLFHRIKAYFSLQKLLIFIQVYLSIYFSILCSSSLVTGLEPLRFFYATSQSTYVSVQVLQTLGYVMYLLLLLMYLVLVFSSETGPGTKMVGLGQTFVGFAVGLHYYVTVFHMVVLRQPPKINWRVHGIYATCFLVSSLLATADRSKKAYLAEGGEEGKKN